jgi:hypothetical protein
MGSVEEDESAVVGHVLRETIIAIRELIPDVVSCLFYFF